MIGFLAETFAEGLHRIMEQARLEGNSKDHLVQPFMWNKAFMKPFSILFKISNNGDSTTSVGRLFRWFSVRNILLQDKYEHTDITDQKNPIWSGSIHSCIHYITCERLRRCSLTIIFFSTQTALEQAKRTSLLLLSFWTWVKLKCLSSSQRKEVSDSGTTSLERSVSLKLLRARNRWLSPTLIIKCCK